MTQEIYGKIFFKKHFGSQDTNSYIFNLMPGESDSLFLASEKSGYNALWDGDVHNYFNIIYSPEKESKLKESKLARNDYLRDYMSSFRVYHFHDTRDVAPLRSECNVNDNKSLKENGSNLPAFLYYLQEKHPKKFRRIEKTIQKVAPFFEGFRLEPSRIREDKIQLEWIEKNYPEGYFNAKHLSDGTLRFIALTTLLLQPNLPSVIIIDEPELGLHPVAINKLSGLLRSASRKESQIIISTQSVNLVSNFESESILTVDRVENESVFNRLKSENLKNWLNDYSLGELWMKSIIQGQP